MLEETYYTNGKNDFKDGEFSAPEWSAPIMVSPAEIKERIRSFNLKGRKIRELKTIGMSYMHRRDDIEETAYIQLEGHDEDERHKHSEYDNIDDSIIYNRYVEIDEPLLIKFDDGDVLEIQAEQEPEFRMSMNCIPWGIRYGTNARNVDANIMFKPAIGKTITNVEVKTYATDTEPMSHFCFDDEHSKREFVSDIILWLDDGNGIKISGWYDFCEVSFINSVYKINTVSFRDLKPALCNTEDRRTDEYSGYVADSPYIYFGEMSSDYIPKPYITIKPTGIRSSLYISHYDDFLLFDWSIICHIRDFFDEYGSYEFSFNQWNEILSSAEKIISFNNFDDLFDYLVGLNITYTDRQNEKRNIFVGRLNVFGKTYWDNRDKYIEEYNDIKAWSDLILSDGQVMEVIGC